MTPMSEIEIGAGVFVSFNGWHVRLRTMGDHREEKIFLGPDATERWRNFSQR
jgi:hypothetical protein